MRTSNPALSDSVFRNAAMEATGAPVMTLEGTVVKTGILLTILTGAAAFTWSQTMGNLNAGAAAGPYIMIGGIGGLVMALITSFKPQFSPVTAPIYALLEGLALGGISAMYESAYNGISVQAVGLTFGTLGVLLVAYISGIAKPTEKFKLGIIAATGAICLFYVVTMILGFFHVQFASSVFGNGPIGIGFSAVVVVVAALNLVLDFDTIENGVRQSAPKYMEWYGGFALLVTLVWLYIEILRLLSKLRSRN